MEARAHRWRSQVAGPCIPQRLAPVRESGGAVHNTPLCRHNGRRQAPSLTEVAEEFLFDDKLLLEEINIGKDDAVVVLEPQVPGGQGVEVGRGAPT